MPRYGAEARKGERDLSKILILGKGEEGFDPVLLCVLP